MPEVEINVTTSIGAPLKPVGPSLLYGLPPPALNAEKNESILLKMAFLGLYLYIFFHQRYRWGNRNMICMAELRLMAIETAWV